MFIKHHRSAASAFLNHKIDGEVVIQPDYPLLSRGLRHQNAHHFVSCRIASRTKNSAAAVSRFTSKGEFSIGLVELCTPADELLNPIRSFLDQDTHRFTATQAVSGLDGIRQMDGNIILFAQSHGYSALREDGIAL
jgi:hypothetical protein